MSSHSQVVDAPISMNASSHGAGSQSRAPVPQHHAEDERERSPSSRASRAASKDGNAITSTRTSTRRTVRTSGGGVIYTSHEATASLPSSSTGETQLQSALIDVGYGPEIFLSPDTPDKQRLRRELANQRDITAAQSQHIAQQDQYIYIYRKLKRTCEPLKLLIKTESNTSCGLPRNIKSSYPILLK